jgi:hypothetical protein
MAWGIARNDVGKCRGGVCPPARPPGNQVVAPRRPGRDASAPRGFGRMRFAPTFGTLSQPS